MEVVVCSILKAIAQILSYVAVAISCASVSGCSVIPVFNF